MRPELQAIADKITLYILTKAVASPNPALVSAAKHAEIENQILAYLDSLPEATAFEPITENEFGTHPAFNSQEELDAWLLANGGGDSGDGHTQNTDTGTNARTWQVGQGSAGNTSTFEAVGTAPDISPVIKSKGAANIKFEGINYVLSNRKILALDASSEVVAAYDISEEQVAVPSSLTSPGIPGTWATDGAFLYFCFNATGWLQIPSVSSFLNYGDYTAAVPTSETTPAGQFVGQIAYDLPNGRKYEWEGSQWVWTTINTVF